MADVQPAGGEFNRAPIDTGRKPGNKRPERLFRIWAIVLVVVTALAVLTTAGVAFGSSVASPSSDALATPSVTPSLLNLSPSATLGLPPDPGTSASESGWLVQDARLDGWNHLWVSSVGSTLTAPMAPGEWNDRHPAASPDGHSIAFSSDRDGSWDIYILNLATGDVRRLTDTPAYEGWPTWSPDGRWLAVEAYGDGDLDIWVLAIDGSSAPIQLTNEAGADYSPAWDPLGRRIAFISDRDGEADLFLADLDNPSELRFTNLTQTALGEERDPAFSPSGSLLAYTSVEQGIAHLMVLELGPGKSARPIGQGYAPAWSPAGDQLLASLQVAHGLSPVLYPILPTNGRLPAPPAEAAQHRAAWLPPEALLALPQDGSLVSSGPAVPSLPLPANQSRSVLAPLPGVRAPDPQLSEAAAGKFVELKARVAAQTGWDFLGVLDHAFEGMNDPMPPGWESASWLQTGRGFAFAVDPYRAGWVEIVREDLGAETLWRVFVRAARQDGSVGEPLRMRPWDLDARYRGDPPVYDQGGSVKPSIPAGYYVDFTTLAADEGFERLPALPNWRSYFPGARFNEFVLRQGLSWEQAMLQLYPAAAIATPTAFRTPTLTPTQTPRPTATPYWWRWRTPTPVAPTRTSP